MVSCGGGKHMPENKSTQGPTIPPNSSGNTKSEPQAIKGPTYNEDIHPIFQKYCGACHRPGSGLPNWLDYSQAYAKRNKIMENGVIKRIMPPKGMPQLAESDIAKIKLWIENGAPEQKNAVVTTTQNVQETQASIPEMPTIEPTPKVPYPTLYCEQVEKYPSQKIMSNQILAVSLPKDMKESSMSLTTLLFAKNENVTSVENNVLFRSTKSNPTNSEIEICGVHVDNKKLCHIKSNVQDSLNMKMDVECALALPVHFQLEVVNGSAVVSCSSVDFNVIKKYGTCKIISD